MTAPCFVVDSAELRSAAPGSVVTVAGAEGRHAVTVRRLRVGELVDVVDGDGVRASGIVESISGKDAFDVRVSTVVKEPLPRPRVTVVQALAKGDRGELAVELLTEIGVDKIVPWAAANCVTQWRDDRVERARQRWVDAALSAAKQSRRSRFPVVGQLASTRDVEELVASADIAIVLHEDAHAAIGGVDATDRGDVVVIVGPEGGITPGEIDAFERSGARCVRLGPSVLRTSSAGMAAVAALLAGSSRWALESDGDGRPAKTVEG